MTALLAFFFFGLTVKILHYVPFLCSNEITLWLCMLTNQLLQIFILCLLECGSADCHCIVSLTITQEINSSATNEKHQTVSYPIVLRSSAMRFYIGSLILIGNNSFWVASPKENRFWSAHIVTYCILVCSPKQLIGNMGKPCTEGSPAVMHLISHQHLL